MSEHISYLSLGEVSENISRPFDFSQFEEVVFINTGDVLDGKFLHQILSSKIGLPGQAKKKILKGDLLFSEIRPANKRFARVDSAADHFVVATYFMVIQANSKIDPNFLYVFLSHQKTLDEFQRIAESRSGTFPQITFDAIAHLPIPSLPIKIQKDIVNFIEALDDKIENNRRMNETLEEMARTIFKSWFVDFDPVHAKAAGNAPAHMDAETSTLFPSSFGDDGLPMGWIVGTYGEAMSIYDSKRVPLSKPQRERKQGVFPYYGATSCMDHVDEYLFDGVYLLMGEDGSVVRENGTPFLQYVWGKFWVNNHAHVLQGANGFSTEHLFCGLSSAHITPYVTGAVQLKINQANMKRIPIVVPTKSILSAFSDSVLPFFDKRRLNIEENKTLAELRDTLLPKLISGEIRVADAEREVEAAV